MTAPSRHNASVTPNSQRSFSSLRGTCFPFLEPRYARPELPGTDFPVAAPAGRCSSCRTKSLNTRPRCTRRQYHGAIQRSRALNGYAAGDLLLDFFGGCADQQRECHLFLQQLPQGGVIAAFVFSPE